MATDAVALRIVPSFDVECKFWYKSGGWIGIAEAFRISVRASSFEQAKNEMASALGKHIEERLQETKAKEQAA
jgi:hypothetical protein